MSFTIVLSLWINIFNSSCVGVANIWWSRCNYIDSKLSPSPFSASMWARLTSLPISPHFSICNYISNQYKHIHFQLHLSVVFVVVAYENLHAGLGQNGHVQLTKQSLLKKLWSKSLHCYDLIGPHGTVNHNGPIGLLVWTCITVEFEFMFSIVFLGKKETYPTVTYKNRPSSNSCNMAWWFNLFKHWQSSLLFFWRAIRGKQHLEQCR